MWSVFLLRCEVHARRSRRQAAKRTGYAVWDDSGRPAVPASLPNDPPPAPAQRRLRGPCYSPVASMIPAGYSERMSVIVRAVCVFLP